MKPPNKSSSQRSKLQHKFHRQIREKAARKLKARRERENSIWYGLGLFGLVGWSIAVPTLIGIAIGLWLDVIWESPVSWVLVLLLVGVVLGCLNAWFWIQQESRDD